MVGQYQAFLKEANGLGWLWDWNNLGHLGGWSVAEMDNGSVTVFILLDLLMAFDAVMFW